MTFWTLENALAQLLAGVTEVSYLPNRGNAGDAVQAWGVATVLRSLGVTVRDGAAVMLVSGGGNLVPPYNCLQRSMAKLPRDKRIIVLPSTVVGCFPFLASFKRLTLMAREEVTFATARMCKLPVLPVEDAAFSAPIQSRGPGDGLLRAFRGDCESAGGVRPEGNRDLSLEFGNDWWALDNTAGLRFADAIDAYEELDTDRCHVAIVGAVLGKRVTLRPVRYHKNGSVWAASLERRGVIFEK